MSKFIRSSLVLLFIISSGTAFGNDILAGEKGIKKLVSTATAQQARERPVIQKSLEMMFRIRNQN